MSRVFFSTTTRTISDCGTFLDILISRVAAIAIPILFEQPVPSINNGQFDFDGVTAIGDIGFDLAYGVNETSGVLWALGMVGSLPTATDSDVASKQLRLGPDGLIAKFEKWGLYGIFPSHLWNVAGSDDSYYCNTQIQLVFKVLPGNAWTIGTSPISNYDWKSHEWTIPLNLTVSKTVKFGTTPVRLEFAVDYYIEQPDAFGPEWMLSVNITPVVPNVIDQWVKSLF